MLKLSKPYNNNFNVEENLATELKTFLLGMSREQLREVDREAYAHCWKRAIQRAEIRRQKSIVESDGINNNGNREILSTASIANDSTSEIASPAPEIEEIQPSVDPLIYLNPYFS